MFTSFWSEKSWMCDKWKAMTQKELSQTYWSAIEQCALEFVWKENPEACRWKRETPAEGKGGWGSQEWHNYSKNTSQRAWLWGRSSKSLISNWWGGAEFTLNALILSVRLCCYSTYVHVRQASRRGRCVLKTSRQVQNSWFCVAALNATSCVNAPQDQSFAALSLSHLAYGLARVQSRTRSVGHCREPLSVRFGKA